MKILVIGGNGNISWHCSTLALAEGHDVWVFNRGASQQVRRPLPTTVKQIIGDIRSKDAQGILAELHFDVVIDFLCYTPEHAHQAIALFAQKTSQYIFISSSANYAKPNTEFPISENTVLGNPYWDYAKNKLACEEIFFAAFRNKQFPVTIVRPSHTYDTIVPVAVGPADWTVCARLLAGKPILLHGDGSALWTLTHSRDLASALIPLCGHGQAIGEAFHITSHYWNSWIQITRFLADALNVQDPAIVLAPSMGIWKKSPSLGIPLLGHKAWSDIYDNTKIQKFVPGWHARTNPQSGMESTIQWLQADPIRQRIHTDMDDQIGLLCEHFSEFTFHLSELEASA